MTWASLRRSFGSSASLWPADRPISAHEARPRRAFSFPLRIIFQARPRLTDCRRGYNINLLVLQRLAEMGHLNPSGAGS
jgi:hypothetical protein